ncbi:hypothetical protein H6F50_08995 [Coleofasciculus sp. FACHB-712]|uniref:hypothetical protein n=1 Tax=Coleofasciculus sp. FACHB-712 TaxID=2692789 RepID=UPI0016882743|nr:hypothetical protein [Coleofasciculus sp. FACHB-712]MBD1942489.1 hypothetical protein [Coleofasciculus sp. FACHB-712]
MSDIAKSAPVFAEDVSLVLALEEDPSLTSISGDNPSFAPFTHNPDKLPHNPDKLTGDSLGLLLHNPDQITVDLGERRSPHATTKRSSSYPSVNLHQGSIFRRSPHAPAERSQRQDIIKASLRQQLQEAIAERRLTDCLEHIESLGFLGEQTQLFCLNLAQCLQGGCGV